MIKKMYAVQSDRKKLKQDLPQRDVVQEHKEYLQRWHENMDTKCKVSAFTMSRRIEFARAKKEE
jgi:hypothetical protein